LSSRHEGDMQHVNTMKTKFMEMWDGLGTPRADAQEGLADWVLVIAATNKPWSIDPAVLRRMPRQIYIGLPDAAARASILKVFLKHERADATCDVDTVAASTEGYSGSDLRELVRAASLIPIREAYRSEQKAASRSSSEQTHAREITTEDLQMALRAVKPTGATARQYKLQQRGFSAAFEIAAIPAVSFKENMSEETSIDVAPLPARTLSDATPDSRKEIVKAFLEFGPSSKLNSANLSKALEHSSKSDVC
jgi:SpoVK/Ycf46/Vps4 family AAA+-type ATPase